MRYAAAMAAVLAAVTAVLIASGGGQSCPAFPSFPDASCTGVPSGTSLTTMTVAQANTVLAANNATIDGKTITGADCVEPVGYGGTIKNSSLACVRISESDPAGNLSNPRFTIKDSNLDCGGIPTGGSLTGQGVYGRNFNVLRVEIVRCSDGVFVDSDGSITDSWIHNMAWNPDPEGIHVDGIQAVGGTNVSITHNRIVVFDDANGCTISTDNNGSCNGSSAITSNNASGLPAIDNWHAEYNLVGGGQATVYCSLPSATNSTIQHNRWMSGFNPGVGGEVGAVADCGDDGNGATVDEAYADNLWYDGASAGVAIPAA